MRLHRTRRELVKVYRTELKAGGFKDPLICEAFRLAQKEGRSLAADSITTIAMFLQRGQIAALIDATRESGKDIQEPTTATESAQEATAATADTPGGDEATGAPGMEGRATRRPRKRKRPADDSGDE